MSSVDVLHSDQRQRISRRLTIDLAGVTLLLVGWFWGVALPSQVLLGALLQWLAALLVGGALLVRGFRNLLSDSPQQISEQLFALAALAALTMGDFITATLLPLALDVGRIFEERSAIGASEALQRIRGMQAEEATIVDEQGTRVVSVAQLSVGARVLVRVGELVPADGEIVEGESQLDQASLTGESLPEKLAVGQSVYGGSRNLGSPLVIEVTGVGGESAIGKVLAALESAQLSILPRHFEVWLSGYLPLVLTVAATVLFVTGELQRAIAVMVVAVPTGLALARSASVVAGFSKAAQLGALIKRADVFEQLPSCDVVVLDKTGTLTTAEQRVSLDGVSDLLAEGAVAAAQRSAHPISRAIALGRPLVDTGWVSEEHPGLGVIAQLLQDTQQHQVVLGRRSLLLEHGVVESELPAEPTSRGAWVVLQHRASEQEQWSTVELHYLSAQDSLRDSAQQLVAGLRAEVSPRLLLVTGDKRAEAQRIAEQLGIEEVHAEVLPAEKQSLVNELQRQGHRVLMLGDGLNDAIALQSADVGLAVGVSLNQAAAGGADASLLRGQLDDVLSLLALANKVVRSTALNIGLTIALGLLLLVLASLGLIGPLLGAVLQHSGVLLVLITAGWVLGSGELD